MLGVWGLCPHPLIISQEIAVIDELFKVYLIPMFQKIHSHYLKSELRPLPKLSDWRLVTRKKPTGKSRAFALLFVFVRC